MVDDSELVRRCQTGQLSCLDALVDRYQTPLYTMCRKLTGSTSEADDLFQDTWVRAMRGIGRFRPGERFLPWLLSICVNRYRDQYRTRKRWRHRILNHWDQPRADMAVSRVQSEDHKPDEALEHREVVATVRRAVDALDDVHRLPVLLHYFQQLSIAEIAEILDIPVGTVKTRLAAARRKLKPLVEEVEHE